MRLMIFKSIRWRLQIWYGIILLTVLAGFGVTAYQLERGQKFRRIDEDLRQRANAIANAMRLPPRGPGPDDPPFGHPPPGGPVSPPMEQPRHPRGFEDEPGPGMGRRMAGEFELPPRLAIY